MIASLPMYDRSEMHAVHDAFWAALRAALAARGIAAPERLSRGGDPAAEWRRPDLLLGQTCGLPYRAGLHERVHLVATPDHGVPDTPPGYYRSVFVARWDDPRPRPEDFAGAALAYNDGSSHSGWAAPWLAGLGLRPALATGSHRASALAVAEGQAEIAALDAVTWRLLCRFEPALAARLAEVGRSAAAPGLPLITADPALVAPLRAALPEALAALAPAPRRALGIRGFVAIPPETYLAVPIPPAPEAVLAEMA